MFCELGQFKVLWAHFYYSCIDAILTMTEPNLKYSATWSMNDWKSFPTSNNLPWSPWKTPTARSVGYLSVRTILLTMNYTWLTAWPEDLKGEAIAFSRPAATLVIGCLANMWLWLDAKYVTLKILCRLINLNTGRNRGTIALTETEAVSS